MKIKLKDLNSEKNMDAVWSSCDSTVFRIKGDNPEIEEYVRHLITSVYSEELYLHIAKDKRHEITYYSFLSEKEVYELEVRLERAKKS
jgi:hypothetical protein